MKIIFWIFEIFGIFRFPKKRIFIPTQAERVSHPINNLRHFKNLLFEKAINEILQGLQRTTSVRRPLTKRKVESPQDRD